MTEEGDAPVVPLFPSVGERAPARRAEKETRVRYCRHRHVILDHERRTVECDDCGETVDPFTVLEGFAQEWEGVRAWSEAHKAEERVVRKRVEELKREERNAKARKRRRERHG